MEREHILLALLEFIMSFRPKLENGGVYVPLRFSITTGSST